MTSLDLNIGDLHKHGAENDFGPRAMARERTERRLGAMLLATVAALTLAAMSAGTSISPERSSSVIESRNMSQVFDVSKGVRRL